MDYAEFLSNVITQVVASIPEITLIATTLIYGVRMLKAKTQEFPGLLSNTEDKLNRSLLDTRTDLLSQVKDFSKDLGSQVENFSETLNKEVTRLGFELTEKVNGTLVHMQEELNTYEATQIQMQKHLDLLVEENRAIIDMLIQVSGQDVKAIRDGVHKKITEIADNRKKEV
jgi:hypothetical protein